MSLVIRTKLTSFQKLQPFFPPLEQLQSFNLRAAIFRCLNQLKTDSVLGKDVTLRKTMFDDCKGEKFLELMVAFSTLVLRKVVTASGEGANSVSRQLFAKDKTQMTEKRSMLPLAISHRGSLQTVLRNRAQLRARYMDFSQVLDLKDREVDRRFEKVVETQDYLDENIAPEATVARISKQFERHWHGDPRYVNAITQGDQSTTSDGILDRPFHEVWPEVSQGTYDPDFETTCQSLLQDLERRVSVQSGRLRKWQAMKANMQEKASSKVVTASPSRIAERTSPNKAREKERVFSPRKSPRKSEFPIPVKTSPSPQDATGFPLVTTESSMMPERAVDVVKRSDDDFIKRRRSQANAIFEDSPSTENNDSGFSEISSQDVTTHFELKGTSPLHSSKEDMIGIAESPSNNSKLDRHVDSEGFAVPQLRNNFRRYSYMTSTASPTKTNGSSSKGPVDQKPQPSNLATLPESPLKPLTLLERTRQSMSFVSPSSRLTHTENPPTKPLPVGPFAASHNTQSEGTVPRANLADRTRKSISLVPQSKPKPSRRSIAGGGNGNNNNRRDSRIYPVNQFETPGRAGAMKELTPPNEIFSPGAGYDSVFKSRPKVGFSPTMELDGDVDDDEDEENERMVGGRDGGGDVGGGGLSEDGLGSSPLARMAGKV